MTTTPTETHPPGAATADRPGSRLDSLTGLRALAAFGVFIAHLNVFLPVPHLKGVFALGGAGVPYFFILSGFVLTWTFTEKDTPGWFYGRRFARVWPLMLLSTVTALVIAFGIARGTDTGKTLWLGAASVLLIHGWFQSGLLTSPNPVSWPVSVEAFYYALFPFAVRPLVRRTLRQLAVLAATFVLVGWVIKVWLWLAYPPGHPVTPGGIRALVLGTMSPPARLHEFLLGVIVAAAIRKGWRSPVPVSAAIALLAAALGVLMIYQNAPWRTATIYDALDPVCAPLLALLIASVASRELSGRRSWLGSRVMVAFGNWSYAFFLFHYLVLYMVGMAVLHRHSLDEFFYQQIKPTWADAGWAVLAFALSLALSGALHLCYERPIEKRLRALFRRRAVARTAPAAPSAPPVTQ